MTEEGKATADDGKATAEDKSEPVRPNNESASPSRAKRWKVSDTIVAAAITAGLGAIATVAVAVISHSSDQKTQPPTTTSIAPPPTTAARGPAGSISQIEIDTGGLHVTISGRADPGVDGVFIIIPRASGQGYLADFSNVASDLTWRVKLESDQKLTSPLNVSAYFSHSGTKPGTPVCTSPECLRQQYGPPATSVL
jgi:hypothetical protein